MNRSLRAALLGVLTVVLVAPAVADAAPARRVDPPAPAIPHRYLDQKIAWAPCEFDAQIKQQLPTAPTTECATVVVPMDWHNPDAHPDITLAITHSSATGKSKGLMAVNFGGPAASLRAASDLGLMQPRLFTDYDLLGLDPRGFGRSEQLKCLTTQEKLDALPSTPDYRERTQQTLDADIAWGKLVGEACGASELSPFVSTQQIAYDLDFLRELFKAPKLNYVGYSYGTMLGSWYADTYPSRVGRFVLDSNMAFTGTWQQYYLDGYPRAAQRRFDQQFVPWVVRNADQFQGLGGTSAEVKATYENIRKDLVSLVKAGKSTVRGDDLDFWIFLDLYSNQGLIVAALDVLVTDEYRKQPSASGKIELAHVERAYGRLGERMRQLYSLDQLKVAYGFASQSTPQAEVSKRAGGARLTTSAGGELVNLNDAGYYSVLCNDTKWSKDIDSYRRDAERLTAKYPLVGWNIGVHVCAFWPYPSQDRVIDLKGTSRILMVQSELDVITDYEGARRAHTLTSGNTRMVSVDDEGQHGQYLIGPSNCVDEIGDRFVFDGVLPAKDVVCGTVSLPGETAVFPVRGPVTGGAHQAVPESGASKRSAGPVEKLEVLAPVR